MLKKGFIIIACLSLVLSLNAISLSANGKAVGKITSVKGEVLIFHKDEAKGIKAKVKDVVYEYDTIQTLQESRVQILMDDDSLINLGENAKISLREYLYAPEENLRSSTLDLLSGKARFIVGKIFTTKDSKFQVNTSTSVIGVRDTNFIVWVVSPELTTVIGIDGTVVAKNVLETLVYESVVGENYSSEIASNKCPTTPVVMPAEEMQKILMDTQITPGSPEGETPAAAKDAEDMAKNAAGEKVEVSTTTTDPNFGGIDADKNRSENQPPPVGNPNQTINDNPSGNTQFQSTLPYAPGHP
jgi:hypothetical protein